VTYDGDEYGPRQDEMADLSSTLTGDANNHVDDHGKDSVLCNLLVGHMHDVSSRMFTDEGEVVSMQQGEFTRPGGISIQILSHIECCMCLTRFTKHADLKRHMLTHGGERPYRCDICTKAFIKSNDLGRHKRIHIRDKPYICAMCHQQFSLAGNLKKTYSLG